MRIVEDFIQARHNSCSFSPALGWGCYLICCIGAVGRTRRRSRLRRRRRHRRSEVVGRWMSRSYILHGVLLGIQNGSCCFIFGRGNHGFKAILCETGLCNKGGHVVLLVLVRVSKQVAETDSQRSRGGLWILFPMMRVTIGTGSGQPIGCAKPSLT